MCVQVGFGPTEDDRKYVRVVWVGFQGCMALEEVHVGGFNSVEG